MFLRELLVVVLLLFVVLQLTVLYLAPSSQLIIKSSPPIRVKTQFCHYRFEEENARRLELNQRCLFLSKAAMQWLDIRLQLIGVAVISGLGVIAVIQHQYSSVDPGESRAK